MIIFTAGDRTWDERDELLRIATNRNDSGDNMKALQEKDLSVFFRLARNECSYYTDNGPFKKRHYCSMEPQLSGSRCLFYRGLSCKWFAEAVLPLDQVL